MGINEHKVRDLQKNFPDQWNLFLLSLVDFQQVDASDLLSYHQLASMQHALRISSFAILSRWKIFRATTAGPPRQPTADPALCPLY